ncbi:MAG: hypothetical protein WC841_02545 [Candidatus Shapirobacteria bacterium]|jgi:hypothetical protein
MERNIRRNNEGSAKRHVGFVEYVARVGLATLLLGAGGAAVSGVAKAEEGGVSRDTENRVVLPVLPIERQLAIQENYSVNGSGDWTINRCGVAVRVSRIDDTYPSAPWQPRPGLSWVGGDPRSSATETVKIGDGPGVFPTETILGRLDDGTFLIVTEYPLDTPLWRGKPSCGAAESFVGDSMVENPPAKPVVRAPRRRRP